MTDLGPDAAHGVYGISTAAELVGMGVQTLRLYEARGLVEPDRTAGGTRRYSANDLDRVRRIGYLIGEGLNLSGIAMVLQLESENARLREENAAQRAGSESKTGKRPRAGSDHRPRADGGRR